MVELEHGGINGNDSLLAKRTRAETLPQHEPTAVEKTTVDVSKQVRAFVDDGRTKLVSTLEGVARAVRSTEESMRDGDQDISRYAGVLGDKVEAAARYVRTHEPEEVISSVETIARRQPVVFLGGVFVAGLALGRFLRSSDAPRHEPEPEVSSDSPTRDPETRHYAVAGPGSEPPRDAAPSAFGSLPHLGDDDGDVSH